MSNIFNLANFIKPTHVAPGDGSAVFASTTAITCSNFPFTIDDSNCVVIAVERKKQNGQWERFMLDVDGVKLKASSNVVTVFGGPGDFANTDSFRVYTRYFNGQVSFVKDSALVKVNKDTAAPANNIGLPVELVGSTGTITITPDIDLDTGNVDTKTTRVTIGLDDTQFGSVGSASDVDGDLHGQLRYVGEEIASGNTPMGKITHESPQNGTLAWASATTLTASGFGFTVDDANCTVWWVEYQPTGAKTYNRLIHGKNGVNISANSGTITVEGAGAPFTNTDTQYRCGISADEIGIDQNEDSKKIIEQRPLWSYRSTDEFSATLNATDTTYYVIPFDTYRYASILFRLVCGAGSSATVKVYATNDDSEDIGTITIANWHDVSTEIIGAASFSCVAGTTNDDPWFIDTASPVEYYLIEIDYTDAADSTLTIRAKKTY
jgi:hypothetical protein